MRQYLGSHLTDVEVMAAPIVHPFTTHVAGKKSKKRGGYKMEKKMYSVQIGDENPAVRRLELHTARLPQSTRRTMRMISCWYLSTTGCRNCIRRWKETASCGLRITSGPIGHKTYKEA